MMDENWITPLPIEGSGGGGGKGGKGGGGGKEAYEGPNDLQSRAVVRIVEVISEGQIEGFPETGDNIYKYVFLDNVPVLGPAGRNFSGIKVDYRLGLPSQEPLSGFNSSSREVPVGSEIKKVTPRTIRVEDVDIDAVLIKIRIPMLTFQNKSNGDLIGSEVSIAIDVSTNGGGYSQIYLDEIKGKTTSPYERSYRVNLPKPIASNGYWDIRVRRITDDSTESNIQNKTYFSSYTEIINQKFTYPDTAVLGIEVDAQQFGSSIPNRSYEILGRKIQVPSNYFPQSRKYTRNPSDGSDTNVEQPWNGGFYTAWSDNPAWVLFDILTNERYGLGESILQENIDTPGLYEIARYCDEPVNTGFRNQDGTDIKEPRFRFNGVITGREDAYKVVQSIASCFRGMIYWSSGSIYVKADKPEDPMREVNPSNVINGEFSYSGTSIKARHTAALVTYNDPEDNYEPTPEAAEADPITINALGYRQTEVIAYGCTSRSQAHRHGRWILDTETNETETVTYRASWDHASVMPGDIIRVRDPDRINVRTGGRIISATSDSVTLDSSVVLDNPAPGAYTLSVYVPARIFKQQNPPGASVSNSGDLWYNNSGTAHRYVDGSWLITTDTRGPVIDCEVSNSTGTFTTLTLANPFPNGVVPAPGSIWGLSNILKDDLLYRVIAIKESDDNNYDITALLHDPDKYGRVEQGFGLERKEYDYFPNSIPPVTGITFSEFAVTADTGIIRRLRVSWTPPDNQFVSGYRFRYKVNNDSWSQAFSIYVPEYLLDNVVAGTYEVAVEAVSSFGQVSLLSLSSYVVTIGGSSLLLPPVNIRVIGTVNGTNWAGLNLGFEWDNNPGNAVLTQVVLQDYEVSILDPITNNVLRTVNVEGQIRAIYFYSDNLNDGGPRRGLKVSIKARDVFNRLSNAATAVLTNPVPDVPVLIAATPGFSSTLVRYTPPTDSDWEGVYVWISNQSGFTPKYPGETVGSNEVLPIYEGSDTTIVLPTAPGVTYYMRYAAFDVFGRTGLTLSNQIPFSTPTLRPEDLDTIPPGTPTGLVLSTELGDDGVVYVIAKWNPNGESDFSYYDVQFKAVPPAGLAANFDWISFSTASTTYKVGVAPLTTVYVRVRALDRIQNKSAFTTQQFIQAFADDVPPSPPTALTYDAAIRTIFLRWTNPSDDKYLSHIEIWLNQTGDEPDPIANRASMLLSVVNAISGTEGGFTASGLTPASTYYVWLRAVDTSNNASVFSQRLTVAVPQLTSTDIENGAIEAINLASSLSVPEIVEALPTEGLYQGRLAFLKSNNTIYRYSVVSGVGAWVNTVDTSLLAGRIQAGQIAAGAITTNALAVGDFSNLTENGNFEAGDGAETGGWTKGDNWSIVNDSVNAFSGTWVARHNASVIDDVISNKFAFTVVEGDKFYAVAKIKCILTNANGAFVRVRFIDSSGGLISPTIDGNLINSSTYASSTVKATIPAGAIRARVEVVATNRAGTVFLDNVSIFRLTSTTYIADGAIITDHFVANSISGSVIAVTTLNGDRIVAGSISGDRINSVTSLPGSITVGTTGFNLEVIANQADDPANRINDKTTQIGAGKITITGNQNFNLQSLVEAWRTGGDSTQINGGVISANSVRSNSLVVGSRNLTIEGITFDFNKDTNTVFWYGGRISYPGDLTGNLVSVNVSDNLTGMMWTGQTIYVYWTRDTTSLTATINTDDLEGDNKVIMATYRGGVNLVANFGRTVVDGSTIITDTILANRIRTGSITTTQLDVTEVLRAGNIKTGFLDADTIYVGDTLQIASIGRSIAGVVTVTTSVPHEYTVGKFVVISEVSNRSFDGTYQITAVPNTSQFQFNQLGPVVANSNLGGTILGVKYTAIDGASGQIRVNDGTRDRVKIGKLSGSNYGIELFDANGNLLISTDGVLGSSVYIGTSEGNKLLTDIANNALVPTVNFVGTFSSQPSTSIYNVNSVYKNSVDGNSYVLVENTPGQKQWTLYLEKGEKGDKGDEGQQGQEGIRGLDGLRGARTFYVNRGTISAVTEAGAWSDSVANTTASLGNGPMPGDTVTQYGIRTFIEGGVGSSASFAITKFWSGPIGNGAPTTNSWTSPGVVIDGNLLVTGTIGASKLAVGQLSAITANAGVITAGLLRSNDGKFIIDLDNKFFKIEV